MIIHFFLFWYYLVVQLPRELQFAHCCSCMQQEITQVTERLAPALWGDWSIHHWVKSSPSRVLTYDYPSGAAVWIGLLNQYLFMGYCSSKSYHGLQIFLRLANISRSGTIFGLDAKCFPIFGVLYMVLFILFTFHLYCNHIIHFWPCLSLCPSPPSLEAGKYCCTHAILATRKARCACTVLALLSMHASYHRLFLLCRLTPMMWQWKKTLEKFS